jgi:hypothetical protein
MKDDLEKFIAKNRDQFDTETPPPFVLDRILDKMQPEKKEKPAGILIPFRTIRWAAAAAVILVVGTVAFLMLRPSPQVVNVVSVKPPVHENAEIAQTPVQKKPVVSKSIDSVDNDLDMRKQQLVAKIHGRKPGNERHIAYASFNDNTESPAGRIAETMATEKLANDNNQVIDALVQTLNNDANSNVRLAALDGLAKFYREAYVRHQLTDALKKQHDPVVQIAMINMLVRMRTSGILEQLNQLVNDANTQKPVKDCAYSGIMQLQSS